MARIFFVAAKHLSVAKTDAKRCKKFLFFVLNQNGHAFVQMSDALVAKNIK